MRRVLPLPLIAAGLTTWPIVWDWVQPNLAEWVLNNLAPGREDAQVLLDDYLRAMAAEDYERAYSLPAPQSERRVLSRDGLAGLSLSLPAARPLPDDPPPPYNHAVLP